MGDVGHGGGSWDERGSFDEPRVTSVTSGATSHMTYF